MLSISSEWKQIFMALFNMTPIRQLCALEGVRIVPIIIGGVLSIVV